MDTSVVAVPSTPSPLEDFVRTYLETVGGAWDEIEPQVYDVLLPAEDMAGGVARITFDAEALPEHPGAQLASFGTPFIDGVLTDALRRGRSARFYLVGLNLTPHDLAARVRRALTLAPPLELKIEQVRALHFAQAVFGFQAEFVSDQKEQEIIPVAMDLHYGRQARHLDALLDRSHLAEQPALPLPEARRLGLAVVYPMARDQVVRTVAALANVRGRDLAERRDRQMARVQRYYGDLRGELEQQSHRGRQGEEADTRRAERLQAIDREEQVRLAELRRKSALRVHLRLLQLALIRQPKLLLRTRVATQPLELVWDPLVDGLEAPPCPGCGRPTYALELTRPGQIVCPACAAKPVDGRKHR
jgi:hypothetical protein